MKRALIVFRDGKDRDTLKQSLIMAGYETVAPILFHDVRRALVQSTFDVVVLETKVGDGLSFMLCEDIRERFGLDPIVIMIMSEQSTSQLSICFALGADDVMSKPYNLEELLARIDAHQRRRIQA